jgi:hypothetical protein
MYKPGDPVWVTKSKSGYEGQGTIVDVAYGTYYLVSVDRDKGNKLILVSFVHLKHHSFGRQKPDPSDSADPHDPKRPSASPGTGSAKNRKRKRE